MSGFEPQRLQQLRDVVASHVERGGVGGVAWLVARDGQVETGVVGTLTRGEPAAVGRDSLFRISSMTKPIVAVAALILVEECRLRLDDPVDELLPELADRQVLVDPRGPIDGPTVAARAPITVRDVLTFRLGLGMDFDAPWPQPLLEEMDRLGMGAGPPEPQVPPAPDEWMRRLSTLPLLYQPGERWLYHTGADVLGRPHRSRRRPAARRVPEGTGARPAGDGRHRLRGSGPGPLRHLLHDGPRHWCTARVRRSRRAVGDTTCVPVRRRRAGVHGRRPARVRAHAAVRRPSSRRRAPPGTCLRRGHDDRSAPRARRGAGTDAGRLTGLGVRRRRPGTAHRSGPRRRLLRMGRRVWGRRGPTIPANASSAWCSRRTCSPSAFPPPAVISDFWTCTYSALAD